VASTHRHGRHRSGRSGSPAGAARPGRADDYPPASYIRAALAVVNAVDAGAVAAAAIARHAARHPERTSGAKGESKIAEAIRAARIAALRDWKKARLAR